MGPEKPHWGSGQLRYLLNLAYIYQFSQSSALCETHCFVFWSKKPCDHSTSRLHVIVGIGCLRYEFLIQGGGNSTWSHFKLYKPG